MSVVILRLYIKSKDKTGEVLNVLKKYNVDNKNLFASLKEKGFFEFKLDDRFFKDIQDEIKDFADIEIIDSFQENQSVLNGDSVKEPTGLLALLLFDVFLILSIVNIISRKIELYDLISSTPVLNKVTIFVVILIKIFISYILISGIVKLSKTTMLGRLLNIKIDKGEKNIIFLILLLIIAYFLLESYLLIFKYFGLFLVTFIIIAVYSAYDHLGIALKREKD
ncbi:hypothetical protein [Sulfurihydrogenibium azorense]|uniref:hypothetical protein n=1 Tax=Sulfurihydrogenibium azorense TaxID=309806 RepID=UPI00391C289F